MSQQDSTAPPPGGQAPYGGPRTGLSGRGSRFFDWMRGLGIARSDGWLGGVCAGVAYRLGIDPLIVRGIVVVAAVLGAPLLLIYAASWALLPDRDGRIHLQRLFEGEFEPPMVAIGVMVLLSLIPWASGLWWFDGPFWHLPGWGDLVGRVLWTLVVLGAGIALIVLAARNSPSSASTSTTATTSTASAPWPEASNASPEPPADAPAQAGGTAAAATVPPSTVPMVSLAAEPVAPPAPQPDASTEAVADWQERQAQWRAEHAEWKRRLDEDMRTVRAQRRTELRAQAAAASADAAARRAAYRSANPRIGAAIGWLAVGLSLVAGSIAAVTWMQVPEIARYASAAALAAGTLVLAVTIFIAGLARRRSGFLIFLAILLAVLTVAATVAAGTSAYAFPPTAGAFDGTWSW